jgi:hypothetical protein
MDYIPNLRKICFKSSIKKLKQGNIINEIIGTILQFDGKTNPPMAKNHEKNHNLA